MKTKIIFLFFILAAMYLSCCECKNKQGFIVVSGTGTVMALPDTVMMQIALGKTAATTRQAQEEVSLMIKQALKILEDAGIENRHINTASLRFSPEYDWGSSRRILIGQKAEQVISFSVDEETGRVSNIIDQLIQINGIELQQMTFNVKDTSELFVKSRELAYQKALEKAEQYASLSGKKIVSVINISEEGSMPYSPVSNRLMNNMRLAYSADMDSSASFAGSTVLPSGEMEITSRVLVEFLVK